MHSRLRIYKTASNVKTPAQYIASLPADRAKAIATVRALVQAHSPRLKAAFKAAGKKLDMGKSCVHFESPDDLPLEAIGKLISAISSEKWIEMYEQSRLMTKAGQATKRVGTKRRR